MSLKKTRPLTPSQRYQLTDSFEDVTASKPEKSLLRPMRKKSADVTIPVK